MYTSSLSRFHLQCIIYSIISKLTVDLTLNYVKIFEFQTGSTENINLQTTFVVKCSSSDLKVTTKTVFVIKFNLCITCAICTLQVFLVPQNLHCLTDCKNLFSFHWFCLLSLFHQWSSFPAWTFFNLCFCCLLQDAFFLYCWCLSILA